MIDFEKILKRANKLSDEEYLDYWEKFKKPAVKCKKLEFLQTYEMIDPIDDYKNGEYEKFIDLMKEFHKNAWGGKDNIKRIHYIEEPIHEYLKWEYYTYLIDETYGQDIRITKDRSLFPKKMYDFVLFENGNMFVLDFGRGNESLGVWHVTDKKAVKEVSDFYDTVFEKSENFKGMLEPNEYIIRRLKEENIL